jgi:hypothetical protein
MTSPCLHQADGCCVPRNPRRGPANRPPAKRQLADRMTSGWMPLRDKPVAREPCSAAARTPGSPVTLADLVSVEIGICRAQEVVLQCVWKVLSSLSCGRVKGACWLMLGIKLKWYHFFFFQRGISNQTNQPDGYFSNQSSQSPTNQPIIMYIVLAPESTTHTTCLPDSHITTPSTHPSSNNLPTPEVYWVLGGSPAG